MKNAILSLRERWANCAVVNKQTAQLCEKVYTSHLGAIMH